MIGKAKRHGPSGLMPRVGRQSFMDAAEIVMCDVQRYSRSVAFQLL
jgi:hypothetical protein